MRLPPARATAATVGLTVVAYLLVSLTGLGSYAALSGGFIPERLTGQLADAALRAEAPGIWLVPAWLTPLTATLLHAGVLHIAFNMLILGFCGRFVEAALAVRERDAKLKPGLAEVIASINPACGMFVVEDRGRPVSTAMCVQEGPLAGLVEVGTSRPLRRQGHGRKIVASALKWARKQGAVRAWVQVDAENEAALALYRRFGFEEAYRYHYRQGAA